MWGWHTKNYANNVESIKVKVNKYTSHKKFSEEKQAHVGMEASITNQTRWESMTPQHLTWQSGTSAMFSSKFNGLIARGTTR